MYQIMLKSKIYKARVTAVELEYEGSLTIDMEIMEKVKISPYEKILVANMANGERFETYAIPAPSGSKTICLNGATAHKGSIGDRLIVFAFCLIQSGKVKAHRPLMVTLDEDNNPGPIRDS